MKNLMNSIDKINTVAGLSDPILSGWMPANNVQPPAADRWSAPHLNSYRKSNEPPAPNGYETDLSRQFGPYPGGSRGGRR